MEKMTISVIKADVGSIGGHTKPSEKMLHDVRGLILDANFRRQMAAAVNLVEDFTVNHTGDDICITMTHRQGVGNALIHKLAWDCFMEATRVAQRSGMYAFGQDLLKDAPSGNIRGAGPGVAEIEFEALPKHRPAEAFAVFAADKCGPGAYNHALWNIFCNPSANTGLMLSPVLAKGFEFTVIDMDYAAGDRIVKIRTDEPHASSKLLALLGKMDRFAVESVDSLAYPGERIASVSAMRLHNIAGKYTGKDDPVLLFRTQKIFPAPEEILAPFKVCPYVTGDCRGSHVMALMPVAINTPVRGDFCNPIVSCVAYSVNGYGSFSEESVDMFAGVEWDRYRAKASLKSEMIAEQRGFGVSMAPEAELAYTGIMEMLAELDKRFEIRPTAE